MNGFLGNLFERMKNYPAKAQALFGLTLASAALIHAEKDEENTSLILFYCMGLTIMWVNNKYLSRTIGEWSSYLFKDNRRSALMIKENDSGGLTIQDIGSFSCGMLTVAIPFVWAPWAVKKYVTQLFSPKLDSFSDDDDIDSSFRLNY
jgi:hypothetical protein